MKVKYKRRSSVSLTENKIYEVLSVEKAGIGLLTIPMKITFFHPMILKS